MHNTNTPTHTQRFPLHLLKLVLLGFILQMLGEEVETKLGHT